MRADDAPAVCHKDIPRGPDLQRIDKLPGKHFQIQRPQQHAHGRIAGTNRNGHHNHRIPGCFALDHLRHNPFTGQGPLEIVAIRNGDIPGSLRRRGTDGNPFPVNQHENFIPGRIFVVSLEHERCIVERSRSHGILYVQDGMKCGSLAPGIDLARPLDNPD